MARAGAQAGFVLVNSQGLHPTHRIKNKINIRLKVSTICNITQLVDVRTCIDFSKPLYPTPADNQGLSLGKAKLIHCLLSEIFEK